MTRYAIYVSQRHLGRGYFHNFYTCEGEIGHIALTDEIEKARLYKQRKSAEKTMQKIQRELELDEDVVVRIEEVEE